MKSNLSSNCIWGKLLNFLNVTCANEGFPSGDSDSKESTTNKNNNNKKKEYKIQKVKKKKNLLAMQETWVQAGLARSPGEGNGNPLQYSCLENPMDRGVWWATQSMGSAKSQTQLSD